MDFSFRNWKDPSGNPAITPPWGTLSALNLSTGEYDWQVPLGNDTRRQRKGEADTGQVGKAGPVVTAGGLTQSSLSLQEKDKRSGASVVRWLCALLTCALLSVQSSDCPLLNTSLDACNGVATRLLRTTLEPVMGLTTLSTRLSKFQKSFLWQRYWTAMVVGIISALVTNLIWSLLY